VFSIPSDLLIHDLGVYVTSGMDENIVLETIKQLALNDNTMGSDALDKIGILSSKSVAEIYDKLKQNIVDKTVQQEQQAQMQQQQQMELLNKQKEQLDAKLAEEARQKELDREHEVRIAEIRVIGQSQFSEGGGAEELSNLRDRQLKEQEYYLKMNAAAEQKASKAQDALEKRRMQQEGNSQKSQLEREKLQVQRDKIIADLEKSRIALEIAKENKP